MCFVQTSILSVDITRACTFHALFIRVKFPFSSWNHHVYILYINSIKECSKQLWQQHLGLKIRIFNESIGRRRTRFTSINVLNILFTMNCFVIQCSLSKLNLSNPDITCFVLHIYVWYEWGIMTMACFKFSNKPTLFCLCHIQSVKHQYMMIVLCQRYYVTFHGYFKSTAPWVKKNKLYCMHIMIRDMKNN